LNDREGHSRSSELPLFDRQYITFLLEVFTNDNSICAHVLRTFPVLRSTCSWWVTTYVGKSSATKSAD